MKGFARKVILCLFIALLCCSYVYASGSGSHSHDHHEVQKGTDNDEIVYMDNKDGVDAYLEFYDFEDLTSNRQKGFLVKCHVKASLKESMTGEYLQSSKIVLRATIGHDQFGEAIVFTPVDGNKMQAELFVKNRGEQHYLLIAEIEGLGVKEFHFHHTF